ncbi:MAG: HAMP domain-containing protein [Dehalococcoidia bacterium]
MIYVSIGLVALFSLLAYLSLVALHQSSDLVFEERLTMAKTVATHFDESIRHIRKELEQYSGVVSLQLDRGEGELMANTLEHLSEHLESDDDVLLSGFVSFVDIAGVMPITDPYRPQTVGNANNGNAAIEKALQTGTSAIMANDDLSADHEPSVSVAVPVAGKDGTLLGLLTVDFAPKLAASGIAFLFQESDGQDRLEVITDKGVIVVSSRAETSLAVTHHLEVISHLVEGQKPGVLRHPATVEVEQHIVAYAPLDTVPWGIALEQSERALVLITSLERRMMLLGGLGLVLALAVAWFTTRQVVRPLSRLTAGAQQIAAGDLSNPIPTRGADEVRTLAQSLETMRVRLNDAYDERLRWEKELETRVRARTEEVHQLLKNIISVQEEERKRLSRDLHDETSQTLATLLVMIQTAHDMLSSGEKKGKELLVGALVQATQAMTDIRRIMLDLRPSSLDDLGFIYALRSYAEDRLGLLEVSVEFEVIGEERRLEATVETALFRILQEAVNNAAKHAHAEKVCICLEFLGDKLIATVEDNGQGFDVEGVPASSLDDRLGLEGMKERAALIGAALSFRSQPGRGTTIQVEVPLA